MLELFAIDWFDSGSGGVRLAALTVGRARQAAPKPSRASIKDGQTGRRTQKCGAGCVDKQRVRPDSRPNGAALTVGLARYTAPVFSRGNRQGCATVWGVWRLPE